MGAISAVPGLSSLLGGASAAAPELSGAASGASATAGEAAAIDGPIVAHITDVASGDVSLYVGDRQINYRDVGLVEHLLRAAR